SPASGTFVSASAAGWMAEANGDGKAVLTLTAASLEPGQSKAIDVTFKMNADASGEVENCATARKLPADSNDSNDEECVTVRLDEDDTTEPPPPPPPPSGELDLSLELSGDNSCSTGQSCSGQVTLTNVGSESFTGPLSVAHSFTGGRSARVRYSGGGSGFACVGPNFDRAQCSASLSLAPGAAATYPINWTPNRAANGTYQNCAEIKWTRDGGGGEVAMAQSKLNELGYNAGKADGRAGRRTQQALRAYQRDNDLPQTGQLDEATSLSLLGPAAAATDLNAGNDRACLSVTLETTCTGGRFWSGSACVCPSGESFVRGQCRKPITCNSDKILVNGRCVCRRGWKKKGGICQPPAKACPHQGQYRDRSGTCRCPSGQEVIRGVCKRPVTACTADKILVDGKCVCRKGWTKAGGICVPPIVKTCPHQGQYRDRSGKCRCPSGQEVISGKCKKPPTACIAQACSYKGQTRGRDCKCRCPSGQKVIGGQCKTPGSGGGSRDCPYKGQYRDHSGCRCPSGQKVIGGRCKAPSRVPDIKDKIPCNSTLRKLGVC
ncbi:MAG: peptidoglycan-binding protein, partial [Alphaproteobacteria bacterium]